MKAKRKNKKKSFNKIKKVFKKKVVKKKVFKKKLTKKISLFLKKN
jgi:hypothetical protein